MTSSEDAAAKRNQQQAADHYYTILGLQPKASEEEIRQAYRKLSRLYHPDTTRLPAAVATEQFQKLNEAYGTLNNPARRLAYDRKQGFSPPVPLSSPAVPSPPSVRPAGPSRISEARSAYLDPSERPLSPGEMFALFILGLTFVGCLVLAITIGLTRGEMVFNPIQALNDSQPAQVEEVEPSDLTIPPFLFAPLEPLEKPKVFHPRIPEPSPPPLPQEVVNLPATPESFPTADPSVPQMESSS
ncbi:hypothetical protein BST81_08405 [Leptolyngbya sp. 'hensonii']|uniref:J domain-containing protein n=1 Tax=Leptolyngbya sp. 'hensonii' TaxID=1922337 RepID=UPI00094F76E0|nr:J domain-containing protein [Leptolyngbya sp. 'hensonii']OLP18924.1 hypothetical protein BST81_08405 [Leptolyngbya sp. 'hensonii']